MASSSAAGLPYGEQRRRQRGLRSRQAGYILQPRAGSVSPLLATPLAGHADHLVLLAHHLAQIDVLHRVVRLRDAERTARAIDPGLLHRGGELRLLADVTLGGRQADAQDLAGVVALHGVDVRLQLEGLGIGQAEGVVARRVQAVAVMQRGEQAFGVGALGLQRAIGQEARAVQRYALLQARGGVILDELDGRAASEEGVDRVGLGGRDFGQQGLELHAREGQAQLLDDLAAALLESFLEGADRLVARRVLVRDGDRGLVALLGRDFTHGIGRLPVREGAAEDVRRAHRTRHHASARVGHDQHRAGVTRHLGHRRHHARVHGADDHVHVVALDQLVDVVGGLARVGLVVSDSSSTLTNSISRPPSLPPCSCTYSRRPFSIATPSAA